MYFKSPAEIGLMLGELIVGEGNSGDRVIDRYWLASVWTGRVDRLREVTVALGQLSERVNRLRTDSWRASRTY